MNRGDLADLTAFVAVADRLSFRAAASCMCLVHVITASFSALLPLVSPARLAGLNATPAAAQVLLHLAQPDKHGLQYGGIDALGHDPTQLGPKTVDVAHDRSHSPSTSIPMPVLDQAASPKATARLA
jgi:hypothetical protein